MKITKIILLTIIFSLFTLQVSAVSFANLTSSGTGSINNGNGYFDDPQAAFGYTGTRNVYLIAEDTGVFILEPISYGVSGTNEYQLINSSFGTITDAVIHGGYLYFVDGGILKKRDGHSSNTLCESNDTSAGGCITTITSGIGNSLRVYNDILYFTSGTTALRHLDSSDNVVSDFVISAPDFGKAQHGSFTITTNSSLGLIQFYGSGGGAGLTNIFRCTSSGCAIVHTFVLSNDHRSTFYTTTNYIYALSTNGAAQTLETLYYVANGSALSVDYVATNTLYQYDRVYVGGQSTVGLLAASATQYETFNSNEAGIDSLPTSQGSGIVEYVNKEISVPNPTYFNDSIIPFNINLKFIISAENHTNYQNSMFWHVKVDDPRGLQVYDLNLPAIACVQSHEWWDVLGLFTSGDFSCDGSGTVDYTPAPGQFWLNGTWTVSLTEEIPGTISILSTDTWVITNESSNNTGVINPLPPCPTCGLGTGGTINTNTSLQIIQVFSFVAFWGFIIWLGILFTVIGIMAKSPSGVNGLAVIVVAWLSAVFIALIGLFDPFKIYIIILSTIIAAVLFKYGKSATIEG